MAKKPIRVGFDFDGVVAYNPLRVLRAPLMTSVRLLKGNKKSHGPHFPYPKNPFVKWGWEQAHKTSFFPAKGFEELKQGLRNGTIEGSIVTGRYSFLNDELYSWLERKKVKDLFSKIHVNMQDEQPHKFKERMCTKYQYDYFVEDNWDIVNYLHRRSIRKNKEFSTKIHWIYNILDKSKPYPYKHPNIQSFLSNLHEIGVV